RRGKLKPYHEEVMIVHKLFQKFLETGSAIKCAELLNDIYPYKKVWKIDPETKEKKLDKKDRIWNQGTILYILKNRSYIGELELDNGEIITGQWDPIVVPSLFNQVQELLNLQKITHRNVVKPIGREFPLSGLVSCGIDGHAMTGTTMKYKQSPYSYYRCVQCSLLYPAEQLEKMIFEIIDKIVEDPDNDFFKNVLKTDEELLQEHKQNMEKYRNEDEQKIKQLKEEKKIYIRALGNSTSELTIKETNEMTAEIEQE